MQDQNTNTESVVPKVPAVAMKTAVTQEVYIRKIVEKIRGSENILVALSRDPSVDEICGALGLAMFLDSMQKHTTAIYSGQTPDALQFLQPDGTFETNTDSLRDFIIALSKDKADHLRYKLDGDFVKVYITPYKTQISEEDLEYSYGDFNVDLVLAIGVPTAADLDGALAEYGRIMHDATTVDITVDQPGKFGEIEWSDPAASSVSEMVTKLIFALQGPDAPIDQEIATALLTGIVAATGRFSNNKTNSNTMQLASKLMSMGADQQLIAAQVMDNTPDNYYGDIAQGGMMPEPMVTEVEYGQVTPETNEQTADVANEPSAEAESVIVAPVIPKMQVDGEGAAEAATEQKPDVTPLPSLLVPEPEDSVESAEKAMEAVNEAVAKALETAEAVGAQGVGISDKDKAEDESGAGKTEPVKSDTSPAEKVQLEQPTAQPIQPIVPQKDYSQMMAEALAETTPGSQPVSGAQPIVVTPPEPVEQKPTYEPSVVEPAIEQVDKPGGVPLPPPPAPTTGPDMMPPVLPPVQVPQI